MSREIALSRSRPQLRCFRRRYTGSLSLAAFDRLFLSQRASRQDFDGHKVADQPVVYCDTTTIQRRLRLPSRLCQSFNTHRASIVERFSPIRF
jgi:hypothetical protein